MSREEMLDLIKSPPITPAVFNFDKMKAPPMQYFLTPGDIQYLQYLANSVKLNAKLDYKYDEIDKVLKNRGFEKIGSGTNRVAYKHLEHPGICIKVAASKTACTDSPREMINQEYLKPFVAKIFEVDPTGTIALCERVDPIRNREEFMMIVDDVFDLVTQWFTGKYVVDDIGTNYFMNWGTRISNGFPVLHDYPYFYPLDPHKLICKKVLEDGVTICNGEIDYDRGYNFLICPKCGKVYKAAELAKATANKTVITNKGGRKRMRVQIWRDGKLFQVVENESESKKLENKYAEADAKAAKARKGVVKDENYVKALHANDEKPAKRGLNVTVVKHDEAENDVVFNTDSKFIPKVEADDAHDENEVVVEAEAIEATEAFTAEESDDDGVIDAEPVDEEVSEENPVAEVDMNTEIAAACTAAIYEACEKKETEEIVEEEPVKAKAPAKKTAAKKKTTTTKAASTKETTRTSAKKRSARFSPEFYAQAESAKGKK